MKNDVLYFFSSFFSDLAAYVKSRLFVLVIFFVCVVVGIAVGIFCGIKADDAIISLEGINGLLYSVIKNANFVLFFLLSVLQLIIVYAVIILIGRFAYSVIVLLIYLCFCGIVLGETCCLIIIGYGIAGIPLLVVYGAIDFCRICTSSMVFLHLFDASTERRKYGCTTSYLDILKLALPFIIFSVLLTLLLTIVVAVFSFYL